MNSPETVLSYLLTLNLSFAARDSRQKLRAAGRKSWGIILLLLAVILSGCRTHTASAPVSDYYYLNPNNKLSTIGRVAIVELDNDSSYPEISADITQALYQALQKRQVFGLTVVRQHDPSWRSLQLDRDSTYNLEKLSAIRETLRCDGVLLGTVTEYRPYPHMAVGLRLKLLDLRDGQLQWALEQIWDSADKTTEKHIKSYFKSEKRSGFAPLHEKLAAVSPLEFIKFVSYEVAGTF
ncbi:MAG: hypothetical protein A2168_02240 [Planctomycetes bacterium RBG_13_50_24]|nr:MAG: hypothetical protein A2168_02240 [Planctomycetes bacterium RBG_13_50_24]